MIGVAIVGLALVLAWNPGCSNEPGPLHSPDDIPPEFEPAVGRFQGFWEGTPERDGEPVPRTRYGIAIELEHNEMIVRWLTTTQEHDPLPDQDTTTTKLREIIVASLSHDATSFDFVVAGTRSGPGGASLTEGVFEYINDDSLHLTEHWAHIDSTHPRRDRETETGLSRTPFLFIGE